MPHVGIESLCPGYRQHDRAEKHKSLWGICHHQLDPMARVESLDNGRKADDLDRSKKAERAKTTR